VVGQGEACLAAYLTGSGGQPPIAEELRRHLKERLPEYMIPSRFVLLPALPRTATGKIDRRALPASAAEGLAQAGARIGPRTPLEHLLAGLFRESLGVDQVGLEDNFFELGGRSLQAAMLIDRLPQMLGTPLPLMALFDSPTIAGLADVLSSEDQSDLSSISSSGLLVPLRRDGQKPPWFMVHPPGGIVVCYQALARHLGGDRPFFGIRSRGLHGERELPGRLQALAPGDRAA